MNAVQAALAKLQGKRTYIGMFLLCLLGTVSSGDMLAHDGKCEWLPGAMYGMIGTLIGAATGASLRASVTSANSGKTELATKILQVLVDSLKQVDQQAQKSPQFGGADPKMIEQLRESERSPVIPMSGMAVLLPAGEVPDLPGR